VTGVNWPAGTLGTERISEATHRQNTDTAQLLPETDTNWHRTDITCY